MANLKELKKQKQGISRRGLMTGSAKAAALALGPGDSADALSVRR